MSEMKYFKSIDGDILGNTVYLELDNGVEMELAITVSDRLQVLCYRHTGANHWMTMNVEEAVMAAGVRSDEIIPKLLITPGYVMAEADEPDEDRGAEKRTLGQLFGWSK